MVSKSLPLALSGRLEGMQACPSRVFYLEPRPFSCGGKGGPETGPKGAELNSPGQAPGQRTGCQAGVCLLPASPAAPVPRTTVTPWSAQMAGEHFTFFRSVSSSQAPGAGFRRGAAKPGSLLDVTQRLWRFQGRAWRAKNELNVSTESFASLLLGAVKSFPSSH